MHEAIEDRGAHRVVIHVQARRRRVAIDAHFLSHNWICKSEVPSVLSAPIPTLRASASRSRHSCDRRDWLALSDF